ncbi:hypothetical protein AX14_001296 [Amanita brunnescens Koide BX004]|nr:hypothetical protein AX14_001296 [Amanita brunnescens Koide BX004]
MSPHCPIRKQDMIGIFVHCYQDDIFVFSSTVEEHQGHLQRVFDRLREHRLYLSSNLKKIDLYSSYMDCLGFIIDDEGIHIDPSKIDKILKWRSPCNYHDVQKFNSIIQYLAQLLPNVTDFTSLLTGMCSNNREFIWTDFHKECFNKLKWLVANVPICKPINSKIRCPIWVITDASATGIGAWYGQGPTWDTCQLAEFISCKFTSAQMNYCTWEQELLGVLEALLRWEDKLLGLQFTVVTDHQALTFFNEVPTRSQRCMRWWEYLSHFDFKMQYLKGEKNKVADSLSHYFASDKLGERHNMSAYINANSRLDPDSEDLTIAQTTELSAFRVDTYHNDNKTEQIRDHIEPRSLETEQLSANKELGQYTLPKIDLKDETLWNTFKVITKAYPNDHFFSKIWGSPEHFLRYSKHKDLIWTNNRTNDKVVCMPKGLINGKSIRGVILDACHQTVGHSGLNRMATYIKQWFWWPTLTEDIEDFCKSCGKCQTTKTPHKKPPGWLHTMPIPSRPWESIGMDFTGPFIEVNGYDYILLVVCRMTGMVHLIPTQTDASAKHIAKTYIKEVIRLHSILESIVSDRDTKFTSQFWCELSKTLGQKLLMSFTYQPQTDGSSERAIQTMSQMLHSVVNDYQMNWVEQLPLVEFAMNSTLNTSTGFVPFEVNYGWMPRIIHGFDSGSPRPVLRSNYSFHPLCNVFPRLLKRTAERLKDTAWVTHVRVGISSVQ